MTILELYNLVAHLRDTGAYHRKRGFRLNEISMLETSNHLLEEIIELQAECIAFNRDATHAQNRSTANSGLDEFSYCELETQCVLMKFPNNKVALIEETGDAFLIFFQLVQQILSASNITLDEFLIHCLQKLNKNFTMDQKEVLTNTPGFTRRNRQ